MIHTCTICGKPFSAKGLKANTKVCPECIKKQNAEFAKKHPQK